MRPADWCRPFSLKSAGLMVNYLYDLASIEENHDAYFDQGEVAISRHVAKWLK